MNKINVIRPIDIFNWHLLVVSFVLIISCNEQNKTIVPQENNIQSKAISNDSFAKENQSANQILGPLFVQDVEPVSALQISRFVRRIFQDKKSNLWLGTNGDGVVRFDGNSLDYFSINEGFGGVAVRGIVEDKSGNVWFGTEAGLTKYDGEAFTNFTEKDGLINNDVWSIYLDSKNIIWIGTLQGISRFDGERFTPFYIPETKPDYSRGVTSAKIIHSIMEDSKGKMWFGTNGGAYVYDGNSLTNISEKDGLCSNAVNDILEDKHVNICFATHHNGISLYDGNSFTNFTEKGVIKGNEVWSLFEDKSGNIWFPAENYGVYRYDGESFTNFNKKDGLATNAIQCIFEDKEGQIWLGGWMGLFRYDGKSVFAVTRNGPWDD